MFIERGDESVHRELKRFEEEARAEAAARGISIDEYWRRKERAESIGISVMTTLLSAPFWMWAWARLQVVSAESPGATRVFAVLVAFGGVLALAAVLARMRHKVPIGYAVLIFAGCALATLGVIPADVGALGPQHWASLVGVAIGAVDGFVVLRTRTGSTSAPG